MLLNREFISKLYDLYNLHTLFKSILTATLLGDLLGIRGIKWVVCLFLITNHSVLPLFVACFLNEKITQYKQAFTGTLIQNCRHLDKGQDSGGEKSCAVLKIFTEVSPSVQTASRDEYEFSEYLVRVTTLNCALYVMIFFSSRRGEKRSHWCCEIFAFRFHIHFTNSEIKNA